MFKRNHPFLQQSQIFFVLGDRKVQNQNDNNMKTIRFITLLLLISGVTSCSKNQDEPQDSPKQINLTPKASQVIRSSNDFGIELFTRSLAGENMMLSPLSAGVALTMALNGSNGDTYSQMKEMLKYPADMTHDEINEAYSTLVSQLLEADPKVSLSLANALFYRNGFAVKNNYKELLATKYSAQVKSLDFNSPLAIAEINKWAADNTQQKIKKVIDEISEDTMLFLMNALYFKGNWTTQFEKQKTTLRPFYVKPGQVVDTPTMWGKIQANSYETARYSAIEIPYGRGNFSMVIVVPRDGLEPFAAEFTPEAWQQLTTILDAMEGWRETETYLPRFSFSYEQILNDVLKAMGMENAFNPYRADFSNIADRSVADLYISFVKQNTFVEVNEEGTEAAAVTTIGFEVTSVKPYFSIDKPFVFAIRERTTNTLLFIGSIYDPSV
jgi:serpin B